MKDHKGFHTHRAADRRGDHRDHRGDRRARPAAGADVRERSLGHRLAARGQQRPVDLRGELRERLLRAESLVNLATAPTVVGGDGFIGPDLGTDPSLKSAYTIAVTGGAAAAGAPASCNGAAAGTVVSTYFVGADPAAGGGARFFGSNQGGTIYQSTATVAVTQTGAPSGATPIQ